MIRHFSAAPGGEPYPTPSTLSTRIEVEIGVLQAWDVLPVLPPARRCGSAASHDCPARAEGLEGGWRWR